MEIEQKKLTENQSKLEVSGNGEKSKLNTEKIKLDIINEENRILKETNTKFLDENKLLKTQTYELNSKILNLQKEIDIKEKKILQKNIDAKELEFLRLNLIYSSKCIRGAFKKGFKVGTPEYKECILKKGNILND